MESAELVATTIDIAIGVVTFCGLIGGVLVAYRKKLSAWWTALSEIGPTVTRLEKNLVSTSAETKEALSILAMELALVASSQRVMLDANIDVATFETDADGRNILVNSTYARWLGCDKADLLGWRFLNFVHSDDQDRVREELALARAEIRPYRIRHRAVPIHRGEVFEVEKTGSPIPDPGVPVKWIGMVRKIDAND